MRVVPVSKEEVQRATAVHCESPEKLLGQLSIEPAGSCPRNVATESQERAAAPVYGGLGQGLIHWHDGMTKADQSFRLAGRACECLAKTDAYVFDGVVRINLEVAFCVNLEIEKPVPGQVLEHVVEEPDPRVRRCTTGPVKSQVYMDLGFCCLSCYFSLTH